jgi:hypothetical protein
MQAPDKRDYRRAGWPAPTRPQPPAWYRLALAALLLGVVALFGAAVLLLGL